MASLLLVLVVGPVRFIPHFWNVVSFVVMAKASQDVELPRDRYLLPVVYGLCATLTSASLTRTSYVQQCQMLTCVVESSRGYT